MKMGITYRLFFIILCATGLTILCLLLIMWWSINKRFYQYLGTIDQTRLAQAMNDLGKEYDEKGNWDFLKEIFLPWDLGDDGTSSSLGPEVGPPPLFEPGMNKIGDISPMPPPFDGKRPRGPLIILDADKKPIFGSHPPDFHPPDENDKEF